MRPRVLMLALLAGAAAAATEPDLEDLAEQGAGIDEILESVEPGGLDRLEGRWRWTAGGASLRISGAKRGMSAGLNRSAENGLRWSSRVASQDWRLVLGGWRAASLGGWLQVGGARARLPGAAGAPVPVGATATGDLSAWRRRPTDGALLVRGDRGWRLRAGEGREGEQGRVRVASLGHRGDTMTWDLWGLERAAGRAWAAGLRWHGSEGEAWGEVARVDGPGRPAALQAGAVWRADRAWRVEAALAVADAGLVAVTEGRSPLIPGDAGRGWALRLARGGRDGWRGALLAAAGTTLRPDRGPDERELRTLLELRVGCRPDAATRLDLRLRWRADARDGWEERDAWLPPASSRRVRDLAASAHLTSTRRDGDWSLGLRLRRRDDEDRARHRLLLTAGRDAPAPGGVWRLRASLAWGDDLDLVSVSAPAPGAVVLSHWGDRDAETSLGWRGGLGPVAATVAGWWSPGPAGGGRGGFLVQIQGRHRARAAF